MALKEQLQKLAKETNAPCVTISLNTEKAFFDKSKNDVTLKNLISEATTRVIAEFGKRPVASLLEKLENISSKVDMKYNLDSLHIFLSNDTEEIIKSSWPVEKEEVHVANNFSVRSLIKSYNRSESYLLLLLTQKTVHLYEAVNDNIVEEIKNTDFPFTDNPHYISHSDKAGDAKQVDNMVREYFNKIDKALVKIHNETGLKCVTICTENNYSFLQQVADMPALYMGYATIDYNNTAPHHIAKQSWEIIKSLQHQRRTDAISEMKEAVAQGKVITDLGEIYRAAIDGRADTLIVHQDFAQPVMMKDDRTFDLIDDTTLPNAIDDITNNIAFSVLSNNGKVIFTAQNELMELGAIVLKVRY